MVVQLMMKHGFTLAAAAASSAMAKGQSVNGLLPYWELFDRNRDAFVGVDGVPFLAPKKLSPRSL